MPALVKSNVGSFAGSNGLERTRVWPCRSKYSRNCSRISLPVIINSDGERKSDSTTRQSLLFKSLTRGAWRAKFGSFLDCVRAQDGVSISRPSRCCRGLAQKIVRTPKAPLGSIRSHSLGFSQVNCAKLRSRNRLNGFRCSRHLAITRLKPGVNENYVLSCAKLVADDWVRNRSRIG